MSTNTLSQTKSITKRPNVQLPDNWKYKTVNKKTQQQQRQLQCLNNMISILFYFFVFQKQVIEAFLVLCLSFCVAGKERTKTWELNNCIHVMHGLHMHVFVCLCLLLFGGAKLMALSHSLSALLFFIQESHVPMTGWLIFICCCRHRHMLLLLLLPLPNVFI